MNFIVLFDRICAVFVNHVYLNFATQNLQLKIFILNVKFETLKYNNYYRINLNYIVSTKIFIAPVSFHTYVSIPHDARTIADSNHRNYILRVGPQVSILTTHCSLY